jgi:hypothetical protein
MTEKREIMIDIVIEMTEIDIETGMIDLAESTEIIMREMIGIIMIDVRALGDALAMA